MWRPFVSAFRKWIINPLSVPVVDLVDVPEDDFVFSFHVVRDAFFLDPLHEALQDQGERVRQAFMLTKFLMQKYQPRWRNVCVNYVCSICLDTFYLVLSFHPFLSFISSFIEVNLLGEVITSCLSSLCFSWFSPTLDAVSPPPRCRGL